MRRADLGCRNEHPGAERRGPDDAEQYPKSDAEHAFLVHCASSLALRA